ncbi:hypothetical protein WJX73_010319 [Symbiochloris irregularis]|uniref:IBR domain-containing protein n=1 Tax=Symbiochloris irregularis TaxID=706552 RepID=A0AAW1NF39_9CHLO
MAASYVRQLKLSDETAFVEQLQLADNIISEMRLSRMSKDAHQPDPPYWQRGGASGTKSGDDRKADSDLDLDFFRARASCNVVADEQLSVSQCEIVVPELRDQIEQLYAEAAIPTENKFHCPTCGQQQALQDASVEELGAREGWRRCHNCRSMIERTYGCNHITCLCGTEFCYRCGGPWTAAGCRRGCGLYTEAQMRRHYRPDLEARQQGDEDHDQEFSQCVAIVGAALVALAVFSVGRRVTR